jgi:hypothetical protein
MTSEIRMTKERGWEAGRRGGWEAGRPGCWRVIDLSANEIYMGIKRSFKLS